MKNRNTFRYLPRLFAMAAILFVLCLPAYADVFGRIQTTVLDVDTMKPVPNATVTFHDTAGVHGDIVMKAGTTGVVLSPPLEIRPWGITTTADGYATDTRSVTVLADSTTPVEVDLEAAVEKVIKISANKSAIDKTNTQSSTQRSANFIQKNVAGNGNPQSLNNLLIENPGMVQSTDNQVHPRGEHASSTVMIDGTVIPNATIGRGGQFISPETLEGADIITGAFAPEYGSEAAAIFNLNLKEGTIQPFETYSVTMGSFDTWDGDLQMGGQSGKPLEPGVENSPKNFRYYVDANYRNTALGLEAPQPDPADAHNEQTAATILGHFEYLPDNEETWSLTLNTTPANTEIANRTGVGSYYTPVGQGYGYGGARNANGYLPGWSSGDIPSALSDQITGGAYGAYAAGNNGQGGISSQQADGQDDYQKDNNTFGVLSYRHNVDPNTQQLLAISETNSITQLLNNNPSIDYNAVTGYDGGYLLDTVDNSIEFNPDITRQYNETEISGSETKTEKKHTLKAGFMAEDQQGDETYQFTPQSQLAVDGLANIYSFAQNPAAQPNPFMPAGHFTGQTDALGDPIWVENSAGEAYPVVTVHKDGYYGAGYLQDTWNESKRFTVNYGLRLDTFYQKDEMSSQDGLSSTNSLNSTELEPRVNTAYVLSKTMVGLVSYDKLFTQPPLAQGAIAGEVIKPETWDQYEAAIVKAVASNQAIKVDYYYKNIRNQDDTGILIPFTQVGALTTLNYQYASVHSWELSWNLAPKNDVGTGAFLAYTWEIARPGGLNEVGTPAPIQNDHCQYDTVTTGVNYTWRSQAFTGLTFYYGSGESSSALVPVGPLGPDGAPNLAGDGGETQPRFQFDGTIASKPDMIFGYMGLQLDVINIFDSLAVDNFNSGFSGTRFQEPRQYMLTATAHF